MRVDGHSHAVQESWFGEGWWQALARRGEKELGAPAALIRENVIPALFDEDGSSQLGAMDAAGIDVAVMFPHDWSLEPNLGPAATGWREHNDWYAGLAERHPDRIRWGFGVDPRHPGALEAFTEAVRDRGAVCLKLHPGGGFALDDPVARPFLDRAGELGVPVVLHVGPIPPPLDSSLARPELLDRVAADFPDLRIQAAHTGNEEWRAVAAIAERRTNVRCDLSGWQLRYRDNQEEFHADVREVLKAVGPGRVMWGTDAPYYRPLTPDDEWVAAFVEWEQAPLDPGELDAVLGQTASSFYGLG
ncbi:MAG: amidohydrolase family protein [Actinomycetota bacterium]